MQSKGLEEAEESKKSGTVRDLYAAHIVRQGLNKEGWKLVITGAVNSGLQCSPDCCISFAPALQLHNHILQVEIKLCAGMVLPYIAAQKGV